MHLLPLLALLLAACTSVEDRDAPYLVVLGTAQDGGFPQIGCEQAPCRAAHADPCLARLVASALVVDPRSGKRYLFDATPHLPQQLELARGHAGPDPEAPGRPPLFDGIFLTHAHMGHYTGLMHLGRESYATENTPLYATEKMGAFLTGHGPWSLLFHAGHLEHVPLVPGEPVRLAQDLTVTAFLVPHRPEFSDTVGFLIEGPERAALFLPDIDKWERWDERIEDWIARADVALLDGTFFDEDELPGRDMDGIPHPFIVESLARFADLPAEERDKVRFFHLNHSNPLLVPGTPARERVHAAGMHVANDGEVHDL
ncbi:MAG: MBL fold metallo-hydrolase [Planctomycetota bacterium]|nr:MBL fold metallo-hydrolase [Planctomycetota bacterium]